MTDHRQQHRIPYHEASFSPMRWHVPKKIVSANLCLNANMAHNRYQAFPYAFPRIPPANIKHTMPKCHDNFTFKFVLITPPPPFPLQLTQNDKFNCIVLLFNFLSPRISFGIAWSGRGCEKMPQQKSLFLQ